MIQEDEIIWLMSTINRHWRSLPAICKVDHSLWNSIWQPVRIASSKGDQMAYSRTHHVRFAQVFGSIVKKIRVERKLTQEQLAHEAEIDRGFISGIERGLRKPCITTIFQIAHGLRIRPSELIRFTEDDIAQHD